MTNFLRYRHLLFPAALAFVANAAFALPLAADDHPTSHAGAHRPRNLAIFVFEGVQIIDYTGPWEVFGHAMAGEHQQAFEIYTVAPKAGPITTAMGMSVNPKYTFANAPKAPHAGR